MQNPRTRKIGNQSPTLRLSAGNYFQHLPFTLYLPPLFENFITIFPVYYNCWKCSGCVGCASEVTSFSLYYGCETALYPCINYTSVTVLTRQTEYYTASIHSYSSVLSLVFFFVRSHFLPKSLLLCLWFHFGIIYNMGVADIVVVVAAVSAFQTLASLKNRNRW